MSEAFLLLLFQFHKVQLKVTEVSPRVNDCNMFQFHKVQLKDTQHAGLQLYQSCFNSIRYN